MNRTLLLIAALAFPILACQPYDAKPEPHAPGVHDPGGIFGTGSDATTYSMVSYEALRSTLVDVLKAPDESLLPVAAECAADGLSPAQCPKSHPVRFLDESKGLLGAAIYDPDPAASLPPGTMVDRGRTTGYRVWVLSASSACGKMVERGDEQLLFPISNLNYDAAFGLLLGRAPTAQEIAELHLLRSAQYPTTSAYVFDTEAKKAAAVCTAILLSLEFLDAN